MTSPKLPESAEAKRTEVRTPKAGDDLPSIAGLDAKDGLSRVLGNRNFT